MLGEKITELFDSLKKQSKPDTPLFLRVRNAKAELDVLVKKATITDELTETILYLFEAVSLNKNIASITDLFESIDEIKEEALLGKALTMAIETKQQAFRACKIWYVALDGNGTNTLTLVDWYLSEIEKGEI